MSPRFHEKLHGEPWHTFGTFLGETSVKSASSSHIDTVDGSEIRRSPVEVASLSHYLQGLCIPGGAGFLP